MIFRNSLLSLMLSGSAAVLGCHQTPSVAGPEGAIEFVVMPVRPALTEGAPIGSFDVRGIDSSVRLRVGVGSSRTLRVRLPSGSYAVAWDPAVSFERDASVSSLPADPTESPQIVLVPAGGIASVDVVATDSAVRAAARAALGADSEAGERVARR
jgi:hypothetical protein